MKKSPESKIKPDIQPKQIERRKVARTDQFSDSSNVTMQDIATLVGVSRITVSKYFNGNQGVKAETRKRIEQVCAELNYVPDQNAVRLVKGKANLIGVIIPVLSEPFFAEVLSVIGDEAALMGLRVVIFCSYNDPAREAAALLAMRSTKAHGVIITPVLSQRNADLLKQLENEMRIVFLDSYLSPNCHYVMNDNLQSIGLVTRYLLSRDHKPAFLAAPKVAYPSGPERIAGYSDAMREAGCKPVFVPVDGAEATWSFEAFAMQHTLNMLGSGAWIKEKRTALICATDRLAIGAMAAFRKFGLEPGRDVAFVGHDDLPVCEYLNPSLTTVKQDVVAIGRGVMECMKLESSTLTTQTEYYQKKFNARLIVRESA